MTCGGVLAGLDLALYLVHTPGRRHGSTGAKHRIETRQAEQSLLIPLQESTPSLKEMGCSWCGPCRVYSLLMTTGRYTGGMTFGCTIATLVFRDVCGERTSLTTK